MSDGVFNEFHLVVCRNVLIYFEEDLVRDAAIKMRDSLVRLGFLWLGSRESLWQCGVRESFQAVSPRHRFFRQVPR